MAIYELEQRILFDGAVATQAAEAVIAEMSAQSGYLDAGTDGSASAEPQTGLDGAIPCTTDTEHNLQTPDQTQVFIDGIIGTYDPLTDGENLLDTTDNSELLGVSDTNQEIGFGISKLNSTQHTVGTTVLHSTDNYQLSTTPSREVAFLSSSVIDSQEIVDSLGENVEVIHLEKEPDGVEQITEYLNEHDNISSVHIISHGNDSYITLNGKVIDSAYIDNNPEIFSQWSSSLTPDADILLYACNVAQNESGKTFVSKLVSATGADVAASTDSTGTQGNWTLEYSVDSIQTAAINVIGYEHTLTNYLVTNTSGSADTVNSLSWAVVQTNLNPGSDEITFDSSIDNMPITTDALIEITDDLTIIGSGTAKTIIQAAETELIADHRVFRISSGIVTFSDFTIQNGYSETLGGGGIANLGNLTLTNVTISNNAAPWGAGFIIQRVIFL